MKTILRSLAAAFAVISSAQVASASAPVEARSASAPTSIVLVHGAFADGSAWSRVIPLLHKQGYRVVAVQNTLTSQAADIATTRRVIEAQPGPVITFPPLAATRTRQLHRALLAADILPPYLNYPGGPATGYFRFVISSEHSRRQLDDLINVLVKFAPR